jgi:hypothetical protein
MTNTRFQQLSRVCAAGVILVAMLSFTACNPISWQNAVKMIYNTLNADIPVVQSFITSEKANGGITQAEYDTVTAALAKVTAALPALNDVTKIQTSAGAKQAIASIIPVVSAALNSGLIIKNPATLAKVKAWSTGFQLAFNVLAAAAGAQPIQLAQASPSGAPIVAQAKPVDKLAEADALAYFKSQAGPDLPKEARAKMDAMEQQLRAEAKQQEAKQQEAKQLDAKEDAKQ